MSRTVKIGQTEISGQQTACIAVLTGERADTLLKQLGTLSSADLLAWRADSYFSQDIEMMQELEPDDLDKALEAMAAETVHVSRELTSVHGQDLIICFRDYPQGGLSLLTPGQSLELMRRLAERQAAAALELQLSWGAQEVQELCEVCHEHGVKVLISHHDIHGTPEVDEMTDLLSEMTALGADLPLLTVTAASPQDQARVILAMRQFRAEEDRPLIVWITGSEGEVFRLGWRRFGARFVLLYCEAGDHQSRPEDLFKWNARLEKSGRKPSVYLIGMSGTGKSTVVRQAASLTDLQAVDVDDLLEIRVGSRSSAYPLMPDPGAYCQAESEVYSELAEHEGLLVSVSSTAVLNPQNILHMMNRGGRIIWLVATAETMYRRLQHAAGSQGTHMLEMEDIEEQIMEREDLYAAAADEIIFTDNRDVRSVCAEVCAIILGN